MEFRAPGVRFHPTDAELIMYYLMRKALGKPIIEGFISEVDIYQFHPEDLRAMACFSEELNWYFFCVAGKKYINGDRKKRSTECGYWKPTGNERPVLHEGRIVGKSKTLVFHEGKPGKGNRTDWVMHEYRLEDSELANMVVLCKIFKKGGLGPRNGEQYGARYNEQMWDNAVVPLVVQETSASVLNNSAVVDDSVFSDAILLDIPTSDSVLNNSAVIDDSVFSDAILLDIPTSDGVNVASTSNGVILDYYAVDKRPDMNQEAASEIVSSSTDPVPNHVGASDLGGIYDQLDDFFFLTDLEGLLPPYREG